MPEWSNGAVSKTVDQLAGPRVRIPFSPQRRSRIIPILLLLFLPLHIPSSPSRFILYRFFGQHILCKTLSFREKDSGTIRLFKKYIVSLHPIAI